MSAPREYTLEEVRDKMLKHFHDIARYWATIPNGGTMEERCDGAVFSVLAALDGGGMVIPAMIVVPHPHPDDKAYHQANGDNWFPESEDHPHDLGVLHEFYYKTKQS